ncbi:WecB/TagA/CpsF family glycosyltransferase [Streptomyces sp. NPDC059398]|uniref:WecB/TagA/CpsF family glycosyltransferase n=1 Tax=Streptomyces sp. NPDC059398 TaxID=3346820 RepID=UPI0036B09992
MSQAISRTDGPDDLPAHGLPAGDAAAHGVPAQGLPAGDFPAHGVPAHGVPARGVPARGLPPTVRCAGIPLTPLAPAAAAEALVRLAVRGAAADVHLCGAATFAHADRDPALRRLLRSAALGLPAGRGPAWAVRHGGRPVAPVYGTDLLLDTVRAGLREGLSHYLLGAEEPGAYGPAAAARQPAGDGPTAALLVRYPGARVAGAGPLPGRGATAEVWAATVDRVRESGARIVWISGSDTARQHSAAARLAAAHPAVYVAAGPAFALVRGGRAPLRTRWRRGAAEVRNQVGFLRAAARGKARGRGPYRELAQLLADAEIDLVLDTGPDAGAYRAGLRRAGYRGRVVSFEVLPVPRGQLLRCAADDPGWSVLPYALGDGRGPGGGHRLDLLWEAVTAPGERLFVRLRAPGHEERLLEGAGAYAAECVGLQTRGERPGPLPGYTAVPSPVPGDTVLFRRG